MGMIRGVSQNHVCM